MSTNENDSEIQEELPNDRQVLLKKLSTIFDPKTAIDFVSPKPFKIRRHLTIDDLQNANYEPSEKHFQRLRSMEHYQTTTQSLSRLDLETAYQAFIREQVAQKSNSRDELEQFVRNTSDIDAVKCYLDSSHPLQSRLLYHSSKLNEQRANLIKSASPNKTLRELNENFNLRQYFPETLISNAPSRRSSVKEKETFDNKQTYTRPRTMHVEHGEKKYCVTFLRNSNTLHKPLYRSPNKHYLHRTIESLFDRDTSIVQGFSTASNTSNIHSETFPPLSLSALKEYRPTLTSTIHNEKQRPKTMQKSDFIWEQSIVPPKHK